MALTGVARARAVVDRTNDFAFLTRCGFQRDWPQPIGLMLSMREMPAPDPRR